MKKIIAIILLFSLLILSSCTSKQEIPSEDTLNVNIENFAFSPSTIKIKAGETVTWVNNDNAPHTVTGNEFDSGTLNKNQEYKHIFSQPGTYEYICNFHTSMKGTVIVE